MSQAIIEIPPDNWAKLCDLYKENCNGASGFGLLQTMLQWFEKDSKLHVKIYALNDDWKSDGTFLLILKGLEWTHISFNTLNNDLERLTTALNCLDTEKSYLLFAFPERLKPAVVRHWKYADIDVEQFKFDASVWYHIEKQKALQFKNDVPSGYKLAPLKEELADQIYAIWPHRSVGSIEFVKLLIRFNESIGLFDKAGNLIAWCLRLQIGALGLLQVDENHKRKGFGNLVVRCMAKIVASKNEEVTAAVVTTNSASRALFEKLGFSVIDNVYWALKPSK